MSKKYEIKIIRNLIISLIIALIIGIIAVIINLCKIESQLSKLQFQKNETNYLVKNTVKSI